MAIVGNNWHQAGTLPTVFWFSNRRQRAKVTASCHAIAFRSGSVPEVIEGVTGFVVDDEEQAVQAVKQLGEFDRRCVRERFEERFTAGPMAADYVSHYRSLAYGGAPPNTDEAT
jgi:glycosyltransferase involved in cell wall biosynthesis